MLYTTFFSMIFLVLLAVHRSSGQCASLPSPLPGYNDLTASIPLPDPFTFYNGTALTSPDGWACRRTEIKALLEAYVYGRYPDRSSEKVTATRTGNTVSITVTAKGKTGRFSATLALPSGASNDKPVPAVIVIGFADSTFLNNGIAQATFDANSVAADSTSKTGAFRNIYSEDVGSLLAWGWGSHRVLDALELVAPEIDSTRVGVMGCSRYGKGALAAGIFDDRISLTIPMSSGVLGTSPIRFHYDQAGRNERLGSMVEAIPWWTKASLQDYIPDENRLPVDANVLTAAVAPRAAVWDQGQTEYQMNPEGVAGVTFPATQAVYKFLGAEANIGVALRNSGHCDPSGTTNVLDFVKSVLLGSQRTRNYTTISPYHAHPEAYPWAV